MPSLNATAATPDQPSHDQSRFELHWSIQKIENASSASFLKTIRYLLPEKMREVIAENIELSFADDEDDRFKPISWGVCKNPNSQRDSQMSYKASNLSRLTRDRNGALHIILNPEFRAPITRGPSPPRPSCLHGTDYNLAMATVIHSLTRAYDLLIANDAEFQHQKTIFCSQAATRRSGETPACTAIKQVQRLVSDRSPFQHQLNFYQSIFGMETKQRTDEQNKNLYAQDDPRLLAGPRQAFVASVEDFLLEPDFYCRHPGIWNFLKMHFEMDNPPPVCPTSFHVPVFDRPGTLAVLDPQHIYRIEYIFVHPGEAGLIEKFGHAALRIIGCDPHRATPGPECLDDIDYHWVLTFYGDGIGDIIDGMTGALTSRLFLYSYRSIVKDYFDESRPIDLIPLDLRPDELSTLLGTAWEWNLHYRGRWFDMTNNCVTQTLDLLKASVPRLEFEDFPLLTPSSLADRLQTLPIYGGSRTTIRPPTPLKQPNASAPSPAATSGESRQTEGSKG